MGLLAGLFVATAAVAALDLLDLNEAPSWLDLVRRRVGPAFVFLLVLVLLKFGPAVWRELKYWATRPVTFADAFLLTTFVAFVTASWWRSTLLGISRSTWALPTTLLGLLAGAAELARWARWIWNLRDPGPSASTTATGELLDKVVGPDGLEPLPDLGTDDALDRLPFVETLEAAVRHPRARSISFGLDGPWGSGKTTILNALEKRLRTHNAVVVRFDAWNFREPGRVVGNYLAQLGRALRQAGGVPGLRAQLRRLGMGIAPLAGGRIGDTLHNWLDTEGADSVGELLNEMRTALGEQRRVVVVIVDDLDRLERDELHAALRTLRLFADLPRVAHVLAYDRNQVARVLFPDDASGQVARDYLGKIVQVELSLSTPSPAAETRVLGLALQPLLDLVVKDDADSFVARLNSLPRQVWVGAIPTPREVRRIVAATALLWPRLQRDVNLFDLFMLQLIHIRFPRVFGAVHAHPEWFTQQEWSGDVWRVSEGDRWKKAGQAYVKSLSDSRDSDDVNAARLLPLIFPATLQGSGRTPFTEADARRERRICHPDIFYRYLQLSVPRETIAESSVEDLAQRVRTSPPEVRLAVIQQAIEEAARNSRVAALFDQWDIFVETLGAPLDYQVVRDVAVGTARAAHSITGDYNNPLDPRRTAAGCILKLADLAGNNQQVSELLAEVIRESPFALSGLLVFYTTTPDRDRRPLPNRVLNERAIRGEFDMQVQARLARSPSPLFNMPDDDIGEVLYRTDRTEVVADVFNRALHEHPRELPRVLSFAVKLGLNSPDPDDVTVYSDDLAGLHKRLDLDAINRVTEQLSTEYWDDKGERALVHYFRKKYKQVVGEAAQAAASAKTPPTTPLPAG